MALRVSLPTRGDWVAGVTVALVLVPQAVAYAGLAGVPPVHGLYAAAVAPVIAGLRGSSPYLQTGPVALTSLLTFGALAPSLQTGTETYAAHAALLALVVGGVRLLIGLLGLGFVSYLMSQPVVAGFTFAAALLIAFSQLADLLGVTGISTNPLLSGLGALAAPGAWGLAGLAVGLGALGLTLVAKRVHPLIPGALVASLLGLLLVRTDLIAMPTVGDLPAGLPALALDLPWAAAPGLVVSGVVIALVGFAEAASISRQYAGADRTSWDPDREFVGQGLANLGAGAFAGYPVGGSFSRSALNRLSGARTRWSGVVSGLVVLGLLPFVGVLADLPKPVLAGLIIAAVVPLLDPTPVLRTWRMSRAQLGVAVVTVTASLLAAPRVEIGVLIGVGSALAVHLWRELRLDVEVWQDDAVLHVRPQGVLYFGSAPLLETRILAELEQHPELGRVVLHLQRLGRIDLTGALVLRAIWRDLGRAEVVVQVKGVQPQCRRLVESVLGDDAVGYTPTAATQPVPEESRESPKPDRPPRG